MRIRYYYLFFGLLVLLIGAVWWFGRAPQKLRVDIVGTGPEGLTFKLIKDRGFDKAQGLDLEVVAESSPAEVERRLRDNEIDVGIFPPISAAKEREKGKPVSFFIPLFRNPVVLLAPFDSPYSSVQDLKGKKIATFAKITSLYLTSEAVLRKSYGLSLETDFKLVVATDFAELARLLKTGEVDGVLALSITAPIRKLVVNKEAKIIQSMEKAWEDTGHTMPFSGISAREEWLKKNNGAGVKLARAVYEANRAIKAEPEKIIREYSDFLSIETEAERSFMVANLPPLYFDVFDESLLGDLNFLFQEIRNLGLIKELKEGVVVKLE